MKEMWLRVWTGSSKTIHHSLSPALLVETQLLAFTAARGDHMTKSQRSEDIYNTLVTNRAFLPK